ncbi:hypothetical protein AB0M35_28320 [Micromonospora sp. NPDC051196]|uniref:hypothetical protein n=1 Tax=Micromonospora sp. NPDC051196 TaxID=3155281 RepID=UPI0034315222
MGFFQKMGDFFKAGGDALKEIASGVGKAIGATPEALVKSQEIRHTTVRQREKQQHDVHIERERRVSRADEAEQQLRREQTQADIRARQGEAAHRHDMEARTHQAKLDKESDSHRAGLIRELNDQQQQHALERALVAARLARELEEQRHEHVLARTAHRAAAQIVVHAAIARQAIDQANSPFASTEDKVRQDVETITHGGREPVVLFAPLHRLCRTAKVDDERSGHLLPMHYAWEASPWRDTAQRLTGLFRRPLYNLDADALAVRQLLWDLPVILVHGDVERDIMRINVQAWNMTPSATGVTAPALPPSVRVVLSVGYPEPTYAVSERSKRKLNQRDEAIGAQVSVLCGMFAEWFHVTHEGRRPVLHTQLPSGAESLRPTIAAGSATMLELAAYHGRIEPLDAAVEKMLVYASGGLPDQVRDEYQRALTDLRDLASSDPQRYVDLAHDVIDVLEQAGDVTGARQLRAEAEPVARRALLQSTHYSEE